MSNIYFISLTWSLEISQDLATLTEELQSNRVTVDSNTSGTDY